VSPPAAPLAALSASVAPLTAPTGSAGRPATGRGSAQAEPPSPPLASPSSVFSILLAQGPVPPSRLGLAAAFPARRRRAPAAARWRRGMRVWRRGRLGFRPRAARTRATRGSLQAD
ncbi:hypothetical protein EE612_017317, partial [Oryza sativa]